MKPKQKIILSFLFIILLSLLARPVLAGKADVMYSKAKKAYNSLQASKDKKKYRHSWENVISRFERIHKRFPKSSKAPAALFMMGKLYYGLYRYSSRKVDILQSIDSYRKVITGYPKSRLADDSQFYIAEIYEKKLKDKKRAYIEYQKVVGKFPKGDMKGKAKVALKRLKGFKPPEKKRVVKKKGPGLARVNLIRYQTNPTYTRIVIEVDRDIRYKHNILKKDPSLNKPPRLYLNLYDAVLNPKLIEPLPVDNGLLKRIRTGQYTNNQVRVVIDMNSIANYKVFHLRGDPYKIVIDVNGEGVKKGNDEKRGRLTIAQQFALGINTIVIDPGHGGKDPGAIGRNGLKEKDVVLKIAKKLKKILEKELGSKVLMTREDDTFIPLDDRTAFAKINDADLFISIHVNASPRKAVSGIETYFLNLTADEDSMGVAARENATSRMKMSDLQFILQDLMQNNKINESSRLATFVQDALSFKLRNVYADTKSLGVKQAPFYVLIGADMPSILVETSFISNSKEEKRLRSNSYLDRIAKGISDGLKKYIDSLKTVAYQ
ncbi:MAG: N-acetylmuramoyl-L-alanine amidase [Thermodesulfobacteriota bacterium]